MGRVIKWMLEVGIVAIYAFFLGVYVVVPIGYSIWSSVSPDPHDFVLYPISILPVAHWIGEDRLLILTLVFVGLGLLWAYLRDRGAGTKDI